MKLKANLWAEVTPMTTKFKVQQVVVITTPMDIAYFVTRFRDMKNKLLNSELKWFKRINSHK